MSTLLHHAGAAFVEIENLLIAEIIAGNTDRGLASRGFAGAWPSVLPVRWLGR